MNITNDTMKRFDITDAEINDFWANGQQIFFKKKELLLEEKQINRHLYIVKTGIARAFVTDNAGKDYTKSFYFGKKHDIAASFTSFKLQEPSILSLEAITDVEVWAWHYSYIFDKLANDFRFHRFLRYHTDKIYIRFEEKEIRMLRTTPEERYLLFMEEHAEFIHDIPLQHIATYLGITAETLSRIRKRVGN